MTEQDPVVRPARPADARTATAYHHRCWVAAFRGLLPPGVVDGLDPWRRLPVFEWWFGDGQTEVTALVAELGGEVIGHTVVHGRHVQHLFVDPDHWGRGLGRRLLEEAEAVIRANGLAEAELHTMVGNEPALALYQRTGWILTDEIVQEDDGDLQWQEHVLRKRLSV